MKRSRWIALAACFAAQAYASSHAAGPKWPNYIIFVLLAVVTAVVAVVAAVSHRRQAQLLARSMIVVVALARMIGWWFTRNDLPHRLSSVGAYGVIALLAVA